MLPFLFVLLLSSSNAVIPTVTVELTGLTGPKLQPRFLSWAMGWNAAVYTNDPVMINLAKPLAPAVVRLGGRRFQEAAYNFSAPFLPKNYSGLVLSPQNILGLYNFSKTVGWDFIFCINVATARTANNTWNPTPFRGMLSWMKTKNISLAGWQFGNEPNGFMSNFNVSVSAEQLSAELSMLYSALQNFSDKGIVMAPDVGVDRGYLTGFMNTNPNVEILSTHHYYGEGIPWQQFSTPVILDDFLTGAIRAEEKTRAWRMAKPGRENWLTETSNIAGGGTEESDTYIAGFMWLDKLGIAARLNYSIVCRQTFNSAAYAVVGDNKVPNPDYYTSVLFRKLIGTGRVLEVKGDLTFGRSVRTYAFCSSVSTKALVLLYLNTQNVSVSLNVASVPGNRYVYNLTSDSLTSNKMFLNGNLLQTSSAGVLLTPLNPVVKGKNDPLIIAPQTYGFIYFPSAKKSACSS